MSSQAQASFIRLIGALRYLDDSELLRAWKTAIHVHEVARPGVRYAMATEWLKACELIIGERFDSDGFGEQA